MRICWKSIIIFLNMAIFAFYSYQYFVIFESVSSAPMG